MRRNVLNSFSFFLRAPRVGRAFSLNVLSCVYYFSRQASLLWVQPSIVDSSILTLGTATSDNAEKKLHNKMKRKTRVKSLVKRECCVVGYIWVVGL